MKRKQLLHPLYDYLQDNVRDQVWYQISNTMYYNNITFKLRFKLDTIVSGPSQIWRVYET